MTGLEAILSQIQNDARQEADEILAAANAKVEEILDSAKKAAEDSSRTILQEGEKKAQDIRDRANSAALLERRNSMLAFKQEKIREAVSSAKAALEALPDKEYFELLVQLAAKYAGSGKAEMRLGQKDLQRLPAGFADSLKQAVPQADISISNTPCKAESGFLLIYEGIDVNCTFQSVFEDLEGELRDASAKVLFPEE